MAIERPQRLHIHKRILILFVLCQGVVLTTGGCSDGTRGLRTAVVTGRVTLDGKPLPCGTVTFFPDSKQGTTGPTGVGQIDESGYYRIVTAGQDGAVVGRHKIKVLAVDSTEEGHPWITPEKYCNPTGSGLWADVEEGKENVIDLPLTSSS